MLYAESSSCSGLWHRLALLTVLGAHDESAAPTVLFTRWSDDWSIWWASATSQKYNEYNGRPFRKEAQLCSAQGDRPQRPPMLSPRGSSLSVAKDLSSLVTSVIFFSVSCEFMPPSPWPFCSHWVIICSKLDLIDTKMSSIHVGVAGASPATCSFEQSIAFRKLKWQSDAGATRIHWELFQSLAIISNTVAGLYSKQEQEMLVVLGV